MASLVARRLHLHLERAGIPWVRGIVLNNRDQDTLLEDLDLPSPHRQYLTKVRERDLEALPQELLQIRDGVGLRRLACVMLLRVEEDILVPLPAICDTGSPDYLYLGTGAREALAKMGALKEASGVYPYWIKGILQLREFTVKNPPATALPPVYEHLSVIGDCRVNLVGLKAMTALGILALMAEVARGA